MKKRDFLRATFCCMSLLTMALIYWLSAQNGEQSGNASNGIIEKLLAVFNPSFDSLTPERQQELSAYHSGIFRNGAHFGIFMILSLFVTSFLYTYKIKNTVIHLSSLLFCFAYAVSDEIHQLFVEGRSFQITDIVLDLSGIILGILIITLLVNILKKNKKLR